MPGAAGRWLTDSSHTVCGTTTWPNRDQTAYGSYRGSNNFRFDLFDPPGALRASSHWACFQLCGFGGYLG